MQKSKLTLAVIGALLATSAEAGTYILQANKWGAEQAAAVAAAGGTVRYASANAGLAVVDSANANFLSAVRSSRAVQLAVEDMPLQFKMPGSMELQSEAINPGNEGFWNAQWAPRAIEAPAAWAAGATGNGVRVAVLDGGIHHTHVDLTARVDVPASRNFTSPPPSTVDVPHTCTDDLLDFACDTGTFWHGTHVAGIIAASDNATGTVGIAPEATIVGVKVLHGGTGSFGSVIAGLLYASTEGGADIINMSLGADVPRGGRDVAELTSMLNRAANFANARGSLVVSAAGNDGFDLDHTRNLVTIPAESGVGIAVAATGPLGFGMGATDFSRPASYTNYGKSLVWVSGPGGDFALPGTALCGVPRIPTGLIVTQCWVFDMVLSTSRGAGASTTSYSWAAGTSMAAPAVAAVAALIKQKNPSFGPAQLKAKLAQSATDEGKVGHDEFHGAGFVNARRAVE
jgi:subtilisin family serine protease